MTKEELEALDLTDDQLAEIQLGMDEGVDVSLYARKDLLAIQMRQVRLGLMSGVTVSRYNDPAYDWFQMEEIREGLENHINVDKYASPKVPYMKMRQIRKGLMKGIDLSDQIGQKADVLRQIRKALVMGIDISKYVSEGYNAGQLEEIRRALKRELPIDDYIQIEFRGSSIKEIYVGMEHGIDVSVYADVDYSWRQMREIRLGLEHQLDVSLYNNVFYDWRQMHQIRLGLQSGLDVSSFAKLSFTYREMKHRREYLESASINLGEEGAQGGAVGDINIAILDYGMKAVMTCPEGTKFTKQAIKDAMDNANIVYGILQKNINRVVGTASKGKEIVIAEGKEPVEGKDGYYEFFFDTNPTREPKELDDGFLDFVNVDWYETVKKEQLLAVYHPATKGEDGESVTGVKLPGRNGAELKVLTGKGFTKSEDGNEYTADIAGIIEYDEKRETINISESLEVDEVSNVTGAIDFEGNVHVKKGIGVGSRIKAGGDVMVDGFVEACFIEAGGDIILKNGANGKGGQSLIKAGGEIKGRFFENITLEADVGIQANYCLHCDIYTKGTLDLSSRKGLLLGGKTVVESKINVNNMGNRLGTPTIVVVGMNDRVREIGKKIQTDIKSVRGELKILTNAKNQFDEVYAPEERFNLEIYLKIENAIYTKEKQMSELKERRQEYVEKIKDLMDAKVNVRNHLYEGVKFEINGKFWKAEKQYNVTLTGSSSNIVISQN
ncbi:MAG: FapA family protein [Lachnospiraceae bacterium]|nr:FapA family protein [Lachnospiraceae bacterium]